MDIASITLEPATVEARLAAYAPHHDPASEGIKSAFEALRAGLMVVDLRTVFHVAMLAASEESRTGAAVPVAGGSHLDGAWPRIRLRPSVAIAPANRAGHAVRLTLRGTGELVFRSGAFWISVPQNLRTSENRRVLGRWVERVPATPAFVPVKPGDLILWEANWMSVPPTGFDPALLEPLAGWLYLVREVWDLSDVERAALT